MHEQEYNRLCKEHEIACWVALMQAKVINIFVYLINRGPSTPAGCGILEEAWTGKKLIYSFLKTFGCEAFALIDSENRTKLEAKSKKCVFVGYDINELVIGFGIFKIIKL